MDRYNGYMVFVGDQNGNKIVSRRVQQNMQEQWPTGRLELFRAFDGFVENFVLDTRLHRLSDDHVTDLRGNTDFLVRLFFSEANYEEYSFNNDGRENGRVRLQGTPRFQDVFFQEPGSGGLVAGTFADRSEVFDGIACNDHHMTTQLDGRDSYIRFLTPELDQWMSENTIEFWFKVLDRAVYSEDTLLFSMTSEGSSPFLYYHIYTQGGKLKCAPFGNQSFKDPIVTFQAFSPENEDTYGWWHVACSYSFQQVARGALVNTRVTESQEETMVGLPKFYPQNKIVASFGKPTSDTFGMASAQRMLVKEFRFWSKQLQQNELLNNRYRQVDPMHLEKDLLLTYLRLATGSSLISNFAEKNVHYTFTGTDVQTNKLSFVEDFIEAEKYSYDKTLDKVVSQMVRTYHTVCPVHTYFMKNYCYSEPVNKAVLGIFPRWSLSANTLNWEITLVYSSVINTDVIKFLSDNWSSEDMILDQFFKEQGSSLEHVVPGNILRHESEYKISASLSNEEMTFIGSTNVNFSPSKCKWMDIVGKGVSRGYDILELSPGTEDITI